MKNLRPLPSQQYLRECFEYLPETGALRWRVRPLHHFHDTLLRPAEAIRGRQNTLFAGKLAGSDKAGAYTTYREVKLNGFMYKMHRIIWKMSYDEDPEVVDHRDRNGLNNRLSNLRNASPAQNMRNMALGRRNSTGVKGVSFDAESRKFYARLRSTEGRDLWLGSFSTEAEAAAVVQQTREELHGAFARHA